LNASEAALTRRPPSAAIDDTAPPELLLDLVDERTRTLIDRRRRGAIRRRGWLVRRALAVADVSGILFAFVLTQLAFAGNEPPEDRVGTEMEIAVFALTLPCWVVLARLYGLYSNDEERANHSSVDEFFAVFNMLTVGAWMFFALAYLFEFANPSFPKLALFWLLAVAFVFCLRCAARAACRRSDAYLQNTVIVGAGDVGQRMARKLLQHPEYGIHVVGFVDERPRERGDGLDYLTILGRPEQLHDICRELLVERVIVAFSTVPDATTLDLIRSLGRVDVQVDIVPRLFEVLGPQMTVHGAEGLPLLGLPPMRLSRSSLLLKRCMDVALSVIGLLVLAPLLALIAGVIKLDSHGPVFFRQVRMGHEGRTFRIWKFRTMTADADTRKAEVAFLNKHLIDDPRMFKIDDDPRVTRVGRVLRRYSLDELPQLLNVVAGEMSLVGPRPIVLEEHKHVEGWAERRLDLKPGVTGLWQVLGRDDIPFEEMVELDYRYVTSWSLGNDLKLILQTVPVVIRSAA
jgi:exopolysaccharide biosynthesis polyprenyl glycosylphosphotransferase